MLADPRPADAFGILCNMSSPATHFSGPTNQIKSKVKCKIKNTKWEKTGERTARRSEFCAAYCFVISAMIYGCRPKKSLTALTTDREYIWQYMDGYLCQLSRLLLDGNNGKQSLIMGLKAKSLDM